MYFVNALYYAFSGIGYVSFAVASLLALAVFNQELVEREFGYRNLFIVLGAYALIAMPLAATINGGTGPDFPFFLGCMCPALVVVSNRLEADYKVKRAAAAPAQFAPVPKLGPVTPTMPDAANRPQKPYAPAPATLAADFDVPPQKLS